MIGSATPRDGEPRSHSLPSEISALRAAELAKARWDRNVDRTADRAHNGFKLALPLSLAGRIETLAPTDDGLRQFLDELGLAVRSQTREPSDAEAFAAGLPLEPVATRRISEPQVQLMLADFHQRQCQANLLVTACVGSCFVLTVIGVATLASLTGHDADTGGVNGAKHSTSVAWQKEDTDAGRPELVLASAVPDQTWKSEPLVIKAAATPDETVHSRPRAMPELVLMQQGHELALAPLLSERQAPFLLLRGLPDAAKLSAGQRNPSGAWLVKSKDLGQLTLTIAGESSGDYPLEVYALGDGALAQGRRRLVVRVEPEPARLAAKEMNWGAVLSTMKVSDTANAPVTVDPALLMAKAMRLLDEGDIAGARVMFQRAVEAGNAKAAERLRTLASLSD